MQQNWKHLLHFLQLALDLPVTHQITSMSDKDCDLLVDLATRQLVLPMLHEGILKSKIAIPKSTSQKLQAYRFRLSIHNLKHTKELLRLIVLLREKGIEVTPFKGPILAEIGYGDLNSRFFSDLDFLIKREDLAEVTSIMEACDYEHQLQLPKWAELIYFWHKCEYNFDFYEEDVRLFHIEPHWYIGVPRFQINASYEDIKPLTHISNFHGVPINQLSPEGLLLTTIMHHSARDRWSFLKLPLDIVAILVKHQNNLDWSLLMNEAKRLKVQNMVFFSFALVEHLFGFSFPEKIEIRIHQPLFQKLLSPVLTDLLAESFIVNPQRSEFFRVLNFHLRLRKKRMIKVKIIFFHLLRLIIPDLTRRYRTRPTSKKINDFISIFGK